MWSQKNLFHIRRKFAEMMINISSDTKLQNNKTIMCLECDASHKRKLSEVSTTDLKQLSFHVLQILTSGNANV